MPDIIDSTGLTVKTLTEITTDLEDGLRSIYGNDINLDQNSPDGQLVNIMAQTAVDLRELLISINSSFNPDRASGRLLDERVAINSIARNGGTYTIIPVTVTVDRTVTLDGLDAAFNDPDGEGYTIQDNAGTEFILIDTIELTAGATVVNFRAKEIGEIQTTIGTVTTPVTIVLGVTSVNNASAAIETGVNQETDEALRVRRSRSVALGSSGYLNGIEAAILNTSGVTGVSVYENVTNATDADGIPAHSIWAIVEGGANTDIGNVIYDKKSAGANMRGAVEVDITTATGAIFTAKFDRPIAQDLYLRFDIQPTVASAVFDQDLIKAAIVSGITFTIGGFAETSQITEIARTSINENGGGGVPINVQISDDGISYVDYLAAVDKQSQWSLDVTNIAITEL